MARESEVFRAIGKGAKAVALRIGHRPGVTGENLNAAGRAAGVATAAMQDVDACIFDAEHQAAALVAGGLTEPFDVNVWHASLPIVAYWAAALTAALSTEVDVAADPGPLEVHKLLRVRPREDKAADMPVLGSAGQEPVADRPLLEGAGTEEKLL